MDKAKYLGISSIIGGALWAILWLIAGTRPEGTAQHYRDLDDLMIWTFISLIFILVGYSRLWIKPNKYIPLYGKWGSMIAWFGLLSMIGQLFIITWILVPIGMVLLILGSVLLGIGSLKSRFFSKPSSLLLIIGALLLFLFNTEDWRVFLALPFGMAWLLLGCEMLKEGNSQKNS